MLLIGWDAGDWRFARPLMEAGLMPNLSALVNRGASGNLATIRPVLSPMLWNSIATGKRPSKHGVHGFCEALPDGSGVRPVQSRSRRCKALWNIASQSGLTSNVVGWYASHPAEPVRGAVVSNQFQSAVAPPEEPWPVPPGSVHPEALSEPLAELRMHPMEVDRGAVAAFIPSFGPGGVPDDSELLNPTKHPQLGTLMELIAHTTTIHTSATWLIDNTPWDLMAVYYEGIDRFAHAFMHFHPPKMAHLDDERFERYRHVMSACYQYHDMMLGATLSLAGEDTTVLLLSDHGYHFDHLRPPGKITESDPVAWHHPLGMLAMAGPGVRAGQTILGAGLLDIAPTVLTLLGLPYGLDMDGKPLLEALDETAAPRHVVSWELIDGPDGRLDPDDAEGGDPEAQRQAVQQLVDLGYLDPLSDSVSEQVEQVRDANQLSLVQSLLDAGDTAEADAEIDRFLARRPDAPQARQLRVTMMLRRHEYDEAEAEIDALAELGVDADQLGLLRVQVADGRGDAAAALAQLDSLGPGATASSADLFSIQLQRASLLLDQGRLEEAEAALRVVLERDPNHPLAFDALAAVAAKRGDDEAAVTHCLAAVERVYFLPRTHWRLSGALWRLGHRDAAIRAMQVACHQAPAWETARLQLTHQLREAGRSEEADDAMFQARAKAEQLVHRLVSGRQPTPDAQANTSSALTAMDPAAFDNPQQRVVIVSGLPRSGTSLMMQLLQAAGVEPFTDGKRTPDPSNPRGYYEHDGMKRLAQDPSVLKGAEGHAIKIIHALVEHLPPGQAYHVLWMQRDLDEVLASQRTMIDRLGNTDAPTRDDQVLRAVYEQQSQRVLALLRRRQDVQLSIIEHRRLLEDPGTTISELLVTLGLEADPAALATVVDPELYRARAAAPKA